MGTTTDEQRRVKELEREVRELRKANEILKMASAFFRPGGTRPPLQVLREFVDQHRDRFGVESICRLLQVAPLGYRRHAARRRNPALPSARAQRDHVLEPQVERVWRANMQVYGVDKVWRRLRREGFGSLDAQSRG